MSMSLMLRYGFRFSPDDLGGDGGQPAPPSTDPSSITIDQTGGDTSQEGATPVGGDPTPVAPSGPGVQGGQPAPGPAPTINVSGVRDYLQSLGYDVSTVADDRAAADLLVGLSQQAGQYQRQLQDYQPYIEQVRSHWSDFQQYLADRKQQQQPAAPQQKEPWWKEHYQPVEWDERWRNQIIANEDGTYALAPGAPPDVLNKYMQYRDHVAKVSGQFWQNPYQFLEGGMQTLARQVAQEVYNEQHAQQQQQQFVNSWMQQNANWLYQQDNTGQVLYSQTFDTNTGTYKPAPVLSEAGQRFQHYVNQAVQMGMNIQAQKDFALAAVQRDYAMAQIQRPAQQPVPQPQQPQVPAPTNGLSGLPANPTPAGRTAQPSGANGSQPTRSLAEMLRETFKENGITDADIAAGSRA